MPKVIGAHKQTQNARNATRIHLASSGDIAASTASVTFTFPQGYDLFQVVFVDIHPSVNETKLSFQVSTNGSYASLQNITSCAKRAQRQENANNNWAGGQGGTAPLSDEALYQQIVLQGETASDAGASGELWFYNPHSTTYKKIFHCELAHTYGATEFVNYIATSGYINQTDAILDINFATTVQEGTSLNGYLDDGFIDLYGWVT